MSFDIFLLRSFGWKMGFEPTTLGTTILYSNQLSYIHHIDLFPNRCANIRTFFNSPKFLVIIYSKNHPSGMPCNTTGCWCMCQTALLMCYLLLF